MLNNKIITDIKVAVLLLNWNGAELTVPCIESLLNGIVKPTSIIVVDNASIDNSVQTLKNTFTNIDLIQNECNLGFTGGNNIGLNKILSDNFDYIWVLNNDTVVDDKCLEILLEVMEADSDIAAVSGKILYDDPEDIIWYAGARFNYWTLRTSHKGELQKDVGQYNIPEDVPFISGCCMFIRKSALKLVGLFDNNFFAYSEDFDWCLRAKSLGLRLRYVPQAMIYHKVSATFKKTTTQNSGTSSPLAIYLVTRNRMFLIRKHAKNVFQFLTSTILYFTWNIYYGTALTCLLRINKLKSLIKGIIDGCFNKLTN